MNCPNCGNPVPDEANHCASCGASLTSIVQPQTSLSLAITSLLMLIAATFAATMASVGVTSYLTYTAYYATYGLVVPSANGFLIFAGVGYAASAVGFVASAFAFRGKNYSLSLIGPVVMVISAFVTLICVWYYDLGFSDTIMIGVVPTLALSLASIVFLSSAKASFTDYVEESEEEAQDTEPPEDANTVKSEESDESVFKE